MNERFDELVYQSGITQHSYHDPNNPDLDGFIVSQQKVDRLAELILENIDKIIYDLYHVLPLEQAVVLLTLDEQIKSHFYETEGDEVEICPRCGAEWSGTSCGLLNCGWVVGDDEQTN
jgi:hypothetical protein